MSRAIVVGGGFYGAIIAAHLKHVRRYDEVILLERGARLMERASFVNQARVHNGYHYPRSFTTAFRSVVNAPRFRSEFGASVVSNFTKLYALARRNSRVTARQMERFCQEIGAPLEPAPADLVRLFEKSLVEKVYLAEEQAFDADKLREVVTQRLKGVDVRFEHEVEHVVQDEVRSTVRGRAGGQFELSADVVFNCTYSRLNFTLGRQGSNLKHEIAEMALIEPIGPIAELGVTIMDGPFFSVMPFPARNLHSLSHVRYTPHAFWIDDGRDAYAVLDDYARESRADRMLRDAGRYMPSLLRCRIRSTLFEIKTVLTRNEGDDGRPILFARQEPHGRIISVLGGKIDNVFDVLERLDKEALHGAEL